MPAEFQEKFKGEAACFLAINEAKRAIASRLYAEMVRDSLNGKPIDISSEEFEKRVKKEIPPNEDLNAWSVDELLNVMGNITDTSRTESRKIKKDVERNTGKASYFEAFEHRTRNDMPDARDYQNWTLDDLFGKAAELEEKYKKRISKEPIKRTPLNGGKTESLQQKISVVKHPGRHTYKILAARQYGQNTRS